MSRTKERKRTETVSAPLITDLESLFQSSLIITSRLPKAAGWSIVGERLMSEIIDADASVDASLMPGLQPSPKLEYIDLAIYHVRRIKSLMRKIYRYSKTNGAGAIVSYDADGIPVRRPAPRLISHGQYAEYLIVMRKIEDQLDIYYKRTRDKQLPGSPVAANTDD